jgi:hypothetical protein
MPWTPERGDVVWILPSGLIARETGCWSKPFPAPDWRTPWVEAVA